MPPVYLGRLGDFTGRKINTPYGYLDYRYGPAGSCEIVNVEVYKPYRRSGKGTELLRKLEADKLVGTIYAFTRMTNTPAHAWYRKNKFVLYPVPNLYGVGIHAMICVKVVRDIPQPPVA